MIEKRKIVFLTTVTNFVFMFLILNYKKTATYQYSRDHYHFICVISEGAVDMRKEKAVEKIKKINVKNY